MTDIAQMLGTEAEDLLQYRCSAIPAENLYLPGTDFVDRIIIDNNRPMPYCAPCKLYSVTVG